MNCSPNTEAAERYFEEHGVCPSSVSTVAMHPGTPWWHIAILVVVALLILGLILSAFRIVQEYERGVVFRFGHVVGEREPGLRMLIPFIDKMYPVDLQVVTLSLEPQQVITKDSVSLEIQVVVYYRVVNAIKSVVEIEDPADAIKQLGQAIMRKVVGQKELHELLEHGAEVAKSIESELETAAEEWGLKITQIELKDIDLPEGMRRAMASKAEAAREAEAKVAGAQGEKDSAAILREAADLLSPEAMRLRELQVMREIGSENSTVVVVPSGGFGELAGSAAAGALASRQQA
jgi:regulator of protease activity HflC (stomatin/prohibitin superfamily)